jgi:hypothetical protein
MSFVMEKPTTMPPSSGPPTAAICGQAVAAAVSPSAFTTLRLSGRCDCGIGAALTKIGSAGRTPNEEEWWLVGEKALKALRHLSRTTDLRGGSKSIQLATKC